MKAYKILKQNAGLDKFRVDPFGKLLGALEIEGAFTLEEVECEAIKHFGSNARIFGKGRRSGPYCVKEGNTDFVIFCPSYEMKGFRGLLKKRRKSARLTTLQASNLVGRDEGWWEAVESGDVKLEPLAQRGLISLLEQFVSMP